jgi:CO/xanthine dehydrogenase FAD-binding subunit
VRADSVAQAIREHGAPPGSRYLGGGTNLVDLMRYGVERPTKSWGPERPDAAAMPAILE